ncbi:MAG TPA: hypothetical protein ENL03_05080 [Phycisphaerae bacterium]|nr:hypothetical protein [Phycisphaerae bacterium]
MPIEQNTDAQIVYVHSESMNRELPMMVFLPKSYHQSDRVFPVVELLHGMTSQWNDICEENLHGLYPPTHGMGELADEWQVIIAAPITGNHFYLDSPLKPEIQMATYVGKEVPVFMDANYRTTGDRWGRIIAGFSMGGFGAVRIYCLYPDTFQCCLVRAGVADRAVDYKEGRSEPSATMLEIAGPYKGNEEFYDSQCNCSVLMENLKGRSDAAMVIECGREDGLLSHNQLLRDTAAKLGIDHIYAEYPGGHQWGMQPFRSMLCHLQQFRPTILPEPLQPL